MKEITDRLQLMLVEARELEIKMKEYRRGLKEQVDSILATPPPRSLVARHKEPLISFDSKPEENRAKGATLTGDNTPSLI